MTLYSQAPLDIEPPAVRYGLPFAAYIESPGISVSSLKAIHTSPAHYRWATTEGRTDTAALLNGRIVHTAILEPWRLPIDYAVKPEGIDRRTKAGKAAWADFIERAGNAHIVDDRAAWSRAEKQAEAALSLDVVRVMVDSVPADRREVCAWARCPETGLIRRARFDLPLANGVLVDIKTARSASPEAFAAACANYGYHEQAAQYLDVANAALASELGYMPFTRFAFIVIESEPPFPVAVYYLDPAAIELGRQRNASAMRLLRDCLETDEWPGYSLGDGSDIQTIDLPRWAYRQQRDSYPNYDTTEATTIEREYING